MHVCIIYDCLFPFTVGGGERWYRNLSEQLVSQGHRVTYLTLRQWQRDQPPVIPGVEVVAVGPKMQLYADGGERRFLPPVLFGLGVLAHLLRFGRRYDAVHTSSFPYFSLLAAGAARPLHRYSLVVDWFEVWTKEYWQSYVGSLAGKIGYWVQSLCRRVPQRAFCFAELTRNRLLDEGINGDVIKLSGLFDSSRTKAIEPNTAPTGRRVVFAGRHIPEKHVPALVHAIAVARQTLPDLECVIYGDGPQHAKVCAEIASLGLQEVVKAPGFVSASEVEASLRDALCMVLPSRREGYGLVVIDSASAGVPSIVAHGPDNAAVELIEEGINGFVARSASPEDLAAAIVAVDRAGSTLRRSTADWFHQNRDSLAIDSSLEQVAASYSSSRPSDR